MLKHFRQLRQDYLQAMGSRVLQSLEQAATGPIMPNHKLASTILGKQRFATAQIIRTGESPIQTSTPKQENPNINKEAPSRVKPWTEYALPNSTNPSVARPIISHTRARVNQDVQDYAMMGPIPKSRSLRQTMARQVAPFRTLTYLFQDVTKSALTASYPEINVPA